MIESNYKGNLTEGTEKFFRVMEVSNYRESVQLNSSNSKTNVIRTNFETPRGFQLREFNCKSQSMMLARKIIKLLAGRSTEIIYIHNYISLLVIVT